MRYKVKVGEEWEGIDVEVVNATGDVHVHVTSRKQNPSIKDQVIGIFFVIALGAALGAAIHGVYTDDYTFLMNLVNTAVDSIFDHDS